MPILAQDSYHGTENTSNGMSASPLPKNSRFRFEIALRLIDPSVAIPYWDNVLDGYIPDPRDSIMWSNDFMGESDWNGNVVGGPFAFWRTIEGRPTILRYRGRGVKVF